MELDNQVDAIRNSERLCRLVAKLWLLTKSGQGIDKGLNCHFLNCFCIFVAQQLSVWKLKKMSGELVVRILSVEYSNIARFLMLKKY